MFSIDQALREKGVELSDHMLQWRTELEQLCEFLFERKVQSFLEIGAGSGQLSVFMKDVVGIERVFACDINFPPLLRMRADIQVFHGNHHSPEYVPWRTSLGAIDLVLIDADHELGFRRDYQIERAHPHTFVAFHDICNRAYPALRTFWECEVDGHKVAFVNADPQIRFGIPELKYPFTWVRSADQLERLCGRSCGIGVSWR